MVHQIFWILGNPTLTVSVSDAVSHNYAISIDHFKDGFQRFVNLKSQNSNLKVLVSLGGWNEGSLKFSEVVSSASKRKTLVNAIVAFIQEHQFDGFDLDWEYPARRDSENPEDKVRFTISLKHKMYKFVVLGKLFSYSARTSRSL